MEILPFLLAPFLASLILTGIHAYLGVHVVERGVIFVDLALAQIAALGATLAMSKATGETEHLKDMLVGNILAVSMHDVVKTAVLYGVIGLFHYIFRKQFLLISTDIQQAEARGMNIRFWDFLFYASFGFVVT